MLSDIPYHIIYSSGEHEPVEFFMDSLLESEQFDLGLGFFSSSGFRALSLGFAYFISRGGTMRILINDVLSPEDKEAILVGMKSPPETLIEQHLISDLGALYDTLSSREAHFFKCLSWLIAAGKVEFKAIVPKGSKHGIAHQKFGLFSDGRRHIVAFSGSANFSSNALFNNIEAVSCHRSWTGERTENERIAYFRQLFDKLWEGHMPSVGFIRIDQVKTFIREKFPVVGLDELLAEEAELAAHYAELFKDAPDIEVKIKELQFRLEKLNNKPKFPGRFQPKDYQLTALANWIAAGYKGFFEMATGTGKTITALNCALHLYQQEQKIRCLVLVPSLSLADQWAEEVAAFGFKKVIIANSKNSRWAEEIIQEINKSFVLDNSFFIISTYETFALDRFAGIVSKLGPDVLFIADEAHNFGTPRYIARYPHPFRRRIGLSATPQRYFDDAGTAEICRFFNAEQAPTFRLDMAEAIERGYLCEYTYHPYIVQLLPEELDEYKDISRQLLKFFNQSKGSYEDNPTVTRLMLKRKRIIHKARNKADCLRRCLRDILEEKGKVSYTLVYVPEGKDPVENTQLINDYAGIITNEFGLVQHQFIGETKDRSAVLQQFAAGDFQVLTAMKCLDEGVDVARTETAIFCSSTGNSRQFIQRRGRILRKHPQKSLATIYDMIVVPEINSISDEANRSMERGVLKAELRRVYEFAGLSKYKYTALKILENVAAEFDIDIFSTEISQ